MEKKILALTKDGKLAFCSAKPDGRCKGRCDHTDHQKFYQTAQDFITQLGMNGIKLEKDDEIKRAVYLKRNIEDLHFPTDYHKKLKEDISWIKYIITNNPAQEKNSRIIKNYYEFIYKSDALFEVIDNSALDIKDRQEQYKQIDSKRRDFHNATLGAFASMVADCKQNIGVDIYDKDYKEILKAQSEYGGERTRVANYLYDVIKYYNDVDD